MQVRKHWIAVVAVVGLVVGGSLLVSRSASAGAASNPGPSSAKTAHEYVGAKKCKSCHEKDAIGDQYEIWEKSKHASAMATLSTEKAKQWGKERGIADPSTAKECVACHQTAYDAPQDKRSMKFEPELSVQCESCHGAGADYRKKKIMMGRDQAIKHGLEPKPESTCIACHNDKSPAWNPERYTVNGKKTGFDYTQAMKKIAHPVPAGYNPAAEGDAE